MKIREYSKLEIATFLRDFHHLVVFSTINSNIPFIEIFQWYLTNENRLQYCTREYYCEMVSVYQVMLASKFLSGLYDNYYSFLLENKIEEINIPTEIFLNPNDASRFSKKNVIRYIRNAFNHNDSENHELLKYVRVIKDGIEIPMIEINLKETKPIPFHVRLDMETLFFITMEIKKANTFNVMSLRSKEPININSNNYNEELDKMFYRKFFSRKKLTEEQLIQIDKLIREKGTRNLEQQLANLGFEYKDFSFSLGQKLKIAEDLKFWENKGVKGNDVVSYLISKVMPFSCTKDRAISINECLTDYYIKNGHYSILDFEMDAYKAYCNSSVESSSPFYTHCVSFGINDKFIYNVIDYDDFLFITNSIYYGYIFDTLVTDKEINILNKKTLPREKIRNSFVHMRWFIGANNIVKLFDWGNGIEDEFNKKSSTFWSCNINIQDLQLSVEKYYNNFFESHKKDEKFMDFETGMIFSRIDEKPICIHSIRSGILYSFSLDENDDYYFKLCVIDKQQHKVVANEEQKMLFINMLDDLDKEQKEKYKDILKQVKLELLTSCNNSLNDVNKTK